MSTVNKIFKTSVTLPDFSIAALEKRAKRRGKTMSQIIRDAIETERVLQDAIEGNAKVIIKENDGTLKQLVFR